MTTPRTFLAAAVIAAVLAGCDSETSIGDDNGSHHLDLRNGTLTTHVQGSPDATVDAAGDLRIADKPVVLSPAQRALLKRYYGDVVAVRTAGIETGKAGAAMAGHAISAVAAGLAHGDPDSIGPKIDKSANDVAGKALAICDSLADLQKTQSAIATALPAFKPYATIDIGDLSSCRSDAKNF